MSKSICCKCANRICTYKGCPATQWEPEEDPVYDCTYESLNFMTEDGCYCYVEERKLTEDDIADMKYDEWKDEQLNGC